MFKCVNLAVVCTWIISTNNIEFLTFEINKVYLGCSVYFFTYFLSCDKKIGMH